MGSSRKPRPHRTEGEVRLGPTLVALESKDNEWCHLCGQRSTGIFVEVWLPKNAEHDRRNSAGALDRSYLRMCADCATAIGGAGVSVVDRLAALDDRPPR